MSKNSDDSLIFVMGTLFGFFAGVAAGIMFSPKSGEEIRQELKNIAKDVSGKTPSEVEIVKNAFSDNIVRLKYTIENQLNKINKTVKAGKMAAAKRKEEMESGY